MRAHEASPFSPAREETGADSGLRARREPVRVLRTHDAEHALEPGTWTIGRSAACDIRLSGALVSRRHARIIVSAGVVTLQDLGSRNGVYVNSARLEHTRVLQAGDQLQIGDERVVLAELELAPEVEPADTIAAMPAQRAKRDSFSDDDTSVATRSADVFRLLGHVVDKALALGRGDEAEHLIAAHLEAARADAGSDRGLEPEIARVAAGYAVKLASATGKASWLDYVLGLYHSLDLVLPLALVDEMYVLLRRVRGIDLGALRRYNETLRSRSLGLVPTERFVLQRLIGLERLATWQGSTDQR